MFNLFFIQPSIFTISPISLLICVVEWKTVYFICFNFIKVLQSSLICPLDYNDARYCIKKQPCNNGNKASPAVIYCEGNENPKILSQNVTFLFCTGNSFLYFVIMTLFDFIDCMDKLDKLLFSIQCISGYKRKIIKPPEPSSPRWALIIIGVGALLIVLIVAAVFVRSYIRRTRKARLPCEYICSNSCNKIQTNSLFHF